MQAKSKKQKGNRLEYIIAKFYNRKLDKRARRMPMSGACQGFKSDILKGHYDGWSDECKCRKSFSIYKLFEQAIRDAHGQKPVLHIKADYKEPLTVIWSKDYFELREELQDYENSKTIS